MEKVAPYLTVDGNAYPAVVDGRVKWIVDGYTTSQYYPYSQQEQLSALQKKLAEETKTTEPAAAQSAAPDSGTTSRLVDGLVTRVRELLGQAHV